ncbi:MAG: hypothetical protein IPL10_19395 [Bacteroidetes bacterium]|nr:hypothetical protein [Bacteroidota bacterium]
MIRYNVGYLSPIVSPTVFCNSVGGNVIFNDNYNGPTGGNFQNNLSSSYWAIGTNTYAVGYYTLPISTTTNYTLFAYYNGRPCPGITSGTIHVLQPPPVFTATPSSSLICQGSPITINASAADNYFIINSPTITVGSPFTPTVTTAYTVVGIMNSTPVLCGNGGGQAVFRVSVSACTGINEVTNSKFSVNLS